MDEQAAAWIRLSARSIIRSAYEAAGAGAPDPEMLASFLEAVALADSQPAVWDAPVGRITFSANPDPVLLLESASEICEEIAGAFGEAHEISRTEGRRLRCRLLPPTGALPVAP